MKLEIFEKLTLHKKLLFLLCASFFLLIFMLQNNILWTVESRWAAVCLQMQLRSDYLHPYIYNGPYYDKPLLSYWIILMLAKIFGSLNEWALRLPSAISGLLTIYCTYKLGSKLINHKTGLLAGWLLLTTFYFVFWSRTTSADMMTVAGTMLAVLWYFEHKEEHSFRNYFVFFLIMAITSQTKGLLGFVLPLLVIIPDLFKDREWKQHLNKESFLGLFLAIFIYLVPFAFSALYSDQTIHSSGIQEVIHENIQRFFKPFDHKNPFYTYFIYLPIYTLPWTVFFLPALMHVFLNWKKYNPQTLILCKSLAILFAFLTISGSRRSYYVLPLVPFAAIITSNWIMLISNKDNCKNFKTFVKKTIFIVYIILFIWFGFAKPYYTNMEYQKVRQFTESVKKAVKNKNGSWNKYKILVFNNNDNRVVYYFNPKLPVNAISESELKKVIMKHKLPNDEIIVATKEDIKTLIFMFDDKYFLTLFENSKNKRSNVAILARAPDK